MIKFNKIQTQSGNLFSAPFTRFGPPRTVNSCAWTHYTNTRQKLLEKVKITYNGRSWSLEEVAKESGQHIILTYKKYFAKVPTNQLFIRPITYIPVSEFRSIRYKKQPMIYWIFLLDLDEEIIKARYQNGWRPPTLFHFTNADQRVIINDIIDNSIVKTIF